MFVTVILARHCAKEQNGPPAVSRYLYPEMADGSGVESSLLPSKSALPLPTTHFIYISRDWPFLTFLNQLLFQDPV